MTTNNASGRASLFKTIAATKDVASNFENFPFCVTGYNTEAKPPYMTGYRMDRDGPDFNICLRDVDGINKGTHKRPEIIKFASKRQYKNDPGVEVGGVVYVQEAAPVSPGLMSSRWISVLSHTEDEAHVIMCTAHFDAPRVGKDKIKDGVKVPGTPYSRATILFDFDREYIDDRLADLIGYTEPFRVVSLDDLRDGVLKLLDKNRNVGAGIRLKITTDEDGDVFDTLNLSRGADQIPLETLVEEFITNQLPEGIEDMLKQDGTVLEVIPYAYVFMGRDTASESLKKIEAAEAAGKQSVPGLKASRYAYKYKDEKQIERTSALFGDSVVAIRIIPTTDGGTMAFFTACEPLFKRNETFLGLRDALAYTQTENFAPERVYFDSSSHASNSENTNASDDYREPAVESKSEVASELQTVNESPVVEASTSTSTASTQLQQTEPKTIVQASAEIPISNQGNTQSPESVETTPAPSERARRFRKA